MMIMMMMIIIIMIIIIIIIIRWWRWRWRWRWWWWWWYDIVYIGDPFLNITDNYWCGIAFDNDDNDDDDNNNNDNNNNNNNNKMMKMKMKMKMKVVVVAAAAAAAAAAVVVVVVENLFGLQPLSPRHHLWNSYRLIFRFLPQNWLKFHEHHPYCWYIVTNLERRTRRNQKRLVENKT